MVTMPDAISRTPRAYLARGTGIVVVLVRVRRALWIAPNRTWDRAMPFTAH